MKILVFGREGQLAQCLSECGRKIDALEVIAIGRPDVDLERDGAAASAILAVRPDVIINAAAYTAVDQAEDEPERACRINAVAAGEIAQTAAGQSIPLIHISTDYVFDGSRQKPYDERAATNPLNVYGQSKLAGEEKVREAGGKHLIIRTSWVYSPFGRNFVRTMMGAAEKTSELNVVDDQVGCPTSAIDLAEAILKARGDLANTAGTYHLAGSGVTSWCGFAQAIMAERQALGLPVAEVHPIGTAEWPTKAARPKNSALDCSLFAETFGFSLPNWRVSLPECVARMARERM